MTVSETYRLEQENKRLKKQINDDNEMWKEPDKNKEIVQKVREAIIKLQNFNTYNKDESLRELKKIVGDKK